MFSILSKLFASISLLFLVFCSSVQASGSTTDVASTMYLTRTGGSIQHMRALHESTNAKVKPMNYGSCYSLRIFPNVETYLHTNVVGKVLVAEHRTDKEVVDRLIKIFDENGLTYFQSPSSLGQWSDGAYVWRISNVKDQYFVEVVEIPGLSEFKPGDSIEFLLLAMDYMPRYSMVKTIGVEDDQYLVKNVFGDQVSSVYKVDKKGVIQSVEHRVSDAKLVDDFRWHFKHLNFKKAQEGYNEVWYVGQNQWQITALSDLSWSVKGVPAGGTLAKF